MSLRGMWYFGVTPATTDDVLKKDFERIAGAGFNTVLFAGIVEQDTAGSLKVSPPSPELLDAFKRAASAAKNAGLDSALTAFLIVKDGAWRGTIMPMPRKKWTLSYAAAIAPYAKLAQETGMSRFCIGTEMETLKFDADVWKSVIESVREDYKGPIGFNLNWWGSKKGFEEILTKTGWMADLDFIGISGYFEISTSATATQKQMEAGWTALKPDGESIRSQVGKLKQNFGKPLFFWEIGYRSLDGNAMHPWNWGIDAEPDEMEQADAFLAFLNVFGDGKTADGFAVWASNPELKPSKKGYDIFDKPAETAFKTFFGNKKN